MSGPRPSSDGGRGLVEVALEPSGSFHALGASRRSAPTVLVAPWLLDTTPGSRTPFEAFGFRMAGTADAVLPPPLFLAPDQRFIDVLPPGARFTWFEWYESAPWEPVCVQVRISEVGEVTLLRVHEADGTGPVVHVDFGRWLQYLSGDADIRHALIDGQSVAGELDDLLVLAGILESPSWRAVRLAPELARWWGLATHALDALVAVLRTEWTTTP